jgi:hypothetical protein
LGVPLKVPRIDEAAAPAFSDAVNGCPRLNRRLMRAMDAFIDLQIEMSPVGRLARWIDGDLTPPTDDSNPLSGRDS